MRILISHPDAIGDFVLRQPMLQALAGAGHTLMLVVRPSVEPIARLVCEDATIVTCRADPFAGDFDGPPAVLDAARSFDPELLVCASYAWTPLEEWLVRELHDAGVATGVAAMSGSLKHDPLHGHAIQAKLEPDLLVEADLETPELTKNERMASALLGRSVQLGDPHLVADESALRAADAVLFQLGLDPGAFFLACVATADGGEVRNLDTTQWGEILARWADAHGRRFLLVGSAAEEAGLHETVKAMGASSGMASIWTGRSSESIATLVGLAARSAGYVGRDTGPMHVAAALGRPVVAVFGGGTWPRFLPAIDESVAITMGVPCAGCDWRCHLPEAYCIRRVPTSAVLKAAGDIENDRVSDGRTLVLKPDRVLLTTIAREGAQSSRDRLVQVSVMHTELAEAKRAQSAEARAEIESLRHHLDERDERISQMRSRQEDLESRVTEERKARDERVQDLKVTRDVLEEVRHRARAAEDRLAARTDELVKASARAGAANEKIQAVERALNQRLAQLNTQLDKLRAHTRQLRTSLDEKNTELNEMRASLARAQTARTRAEEGAKESARQLTATQRRERDLIARLKQIESDRDALARLSEQQQQQLAITRSHVDDLLASRWRKIGQRVGVAMTLPWEQQSHNGQS
jgi:ADP-heptose:LPS heptosyltransferase